MAKPKVVWALQSPTLLNLLSVSEKWDMRVADLDGTKLAESKLCKVPTMEPGFDPHYVFCCSSDQMREAVVRFPSATIVQVAHQGHEQSVPEPNESFAVVCFSHSNARSIMEVHGSRVHVINPFFPVEPVGWKWEKRSLWTVLSRPSLRHPMASAGVEELLFLLGDDFSHGWFGEDAECGFLDSQGMWKKMSRCSAYLTSLPPRSGISLICHECMAAGCPVVGTRFGDISRTDADRYNLGLADWGEGFGLATQIASTACIVETIAAEISEGGRQYIVDHYSYEKMNRSIERLLDEV